MLNTRPVLSNWGQAVSPPVAFVGLVDSSICCLVFVDLFLGLGRYPFALVLQFYVECINSQVWGLLAAQDMAIFAKHVFCIDRSGLWLFSKTLEPIPNDVLKISKG